MVSTFGCNNGLILAGARVYYTMAKDGLFFRQAGSLNKNDVPGWALWAQFVVASILCLSGKYGDLLDMISFVVVIFYVLTIAGIFILRKTKPDMPRPYKALGYPFAPGFFIIASAGAIVAEAMRVPETTAAGLAVIAAGVPVYFVFAARKKGR